MNFEKSELDNLLTEMTKENKLPLIEIHMLKATGPALLNRDFNNHIKTINIGGIERVRISQAACRRPIRLNMYNNGAMHSRWFPEIVANIVREHILDATDSFIDVVKESLGGSKSDDNKVYRSGQVLAYSDYDVQNMVNVIEDWIGKDKNDSYLKEFPAKKNGKSNPDRSNLVKLLSEEVGKFEEKRKNLAGIRKELENNKSSDSKDKFEPIIDIDDTTALMGRMSTEVYLDSVFSALHMNHPYSVDEWNGDNDFFVAADDIFDKNVQNKSAYVSSMIDFLSKSGKLKSKDSLGSAHLNDTDIASNVFYHYASISTRILFENLLRNCRIMNDNNLNELYERMRYIVNTFVVEFCFRAPSAKQTSMATTPMPLAVYITIGDNVYPMTADSIYQKIIRNNGDESVGERAVKRLVGFANDCINSQFAINDYRKRFWAGHLENGVTLIGDDIEYISFKDIRNTDILI